MLIVDTRKNVPLDISRLDWNPDNIRKADEETVIIPLYDTAMTETAVSFAYEIGAQYAWQWPDLKTVTTGLMVDCSRSYLRFSLVVGTKPNTQVDEVCEDAWSGTEKERQKAIKVNAGKMAYDNFPVMLSVEEEHGLRKKLFEVLNIY